MSHQTRGCARAGTAISAALVVVLAVVLAAGGAAEARAAVSVRKEIHSLTAPEIDNFRKGVALMQSRPATDPTSWIYQANIHAFPTSSTICPVIGGTTPQPAWNTCQHQSFFFLSWHRMYLYYFERILRTAVRQAIGNPSYDFTLPYWDYGNPSFRDLPSPYRLPASSSNSLYVAQRRATCNSGSQCVSPADAADTMAMGLIPFCSGTSGSFAPCTSGLPSLQTFGGGFIPAPSHFGGRTGQLEAQPHNVVHTAVGGSLGWMSYPECAARDPIFWAHHANIDRLWQVWLNKLGGRSNPITNNTWGRQTFVFFDENKRQVTLTGCQVVNMAAQLNYQYYGLPVNNTPLCSTTAAREAVPTTTAAAKTLAAAATATTLGKAPVKVSLALPAGTRQHLQGLTAAPKPGHLWLAVEGVKQISPGAIYQVYLNLPAGAKPDPAGPHFLGNIALFVETEHAEPETWTFDLGASFKSIAAAKGGMEVTFVKEELGPPEANEPARFMTFSRVSLLER